MAKQKIGSFIALRGRSSNIDPTVGPLQQAVRIDSKIQIAPDAWICPKGIRLLEAIRDSDSLSQAARNAHISYRHAWLLVKEMNMASAQVIRSKRGGMRGGGMTLTPFGSTLVTSFRKLELDIAQRAAYQLRKVLDIR